MNNQEIAQALDKLSFFLAIKNENQFKINAYRKAARCVSKHPQSVEELLLSGQDLTQISGIGKIIAKKIEDLIILGEIKALTRQLQELPESLYELSQIKGIGPKTVFKIYQNHRICSLTELKEFIGRGERLRLAPTYAKKIRRFFNR